MGVKAYAGGNCGTDLLTSAWKPGLGFLVRRVREEGLVAQ